MLRAAAVAGLLVLAASAGCQDALAQDGGARPGVGVESRPAAGSGSGGSTAWNAAKGSAFVVLEGLRADIQMLSALRLLQTRLLEWNAELMASGAAIVSLEASLCEEAEVEVWCEILPATFGRAGGDG